ncbi:MAG: Nudix family hydrolase [Gammaproteobacteria bacterium]|nr:Nudix family hydrolase [Gammaproteobacteria bacterium]
MRIPVAVALIEDQQGRVLLSKRHAHLHQGGLWEFPGGKLEPGESPEQGLRREIAEELGLEVRAQRPLIQIRHDYADRQVLLDVWRVLDWRGEPRGLEGQELAWVEPSALQDYPLPAADRPIVTALRLPDRYLIATPATPDATAFSQRLRQALSNGILLVQFRPPNQAQTLLGLSREMCQEFGAQLLVNSGLELDLAEFKQAELGLHLKSADLMRLQRRPDVAGLVAASCHDPAQLRRAAELGLDFAVLSPVLPTTSHADARPLGWAQFAQWVAEAQLPVYALGGVGELPPTQAWAHGAQGIAGIRGLW